jgi:TnpA family transposase
VATDREAHYVLDEILGNATDLPITEHATDTHGVTLVNFALFDLVGLQLSPRIRDLDKITLYRTGSKADFAGAYPKAGPLLTRRASACSSSDAFGQWEANVSYVPRPSRKPPAALTFSITQRIERSSK